MDDMMRLLCAPLSITSFASLEEAFAVDDKLKAEYDQTGMNN